MRSGGFSITALHRRSGLSLIAIAFTLASFSDARSLVERPVQTTFDAEAANACPGSEEHLRERADVEYEAAIANLTAEQPILTELQPGIRITERPSIIRLLENTFAGVSLSNQTAALSLCNNAVCVLKTILGSEEAAKRLITISLQTGFTISLSPSRTRLIKENVTINGVVTERTRQSSSIWSLTELRRFSFTAKIFPQLRMKISNPTILYRTGFHSSAAAEASSDGWINFYAGAFQNDETPWDGAENAIVTDKVFVHEFCHLIDYEARKEAQNTNVIKGYRSLLTKYQPRSGLGWGVRGANERFVTEYAKTSHAEDFADSCAYFITAPLTLEKRAPEKYAALRDLIFGREFKTATWNRPLFPEVSELLAGAASENRCESDLLNRIEDIRFLGDGWANEIVERAPTHISSMNHSHWWLSSGIFKKSRENIFNEAVATLESSPTYCERGGEAALRLRTANICPETQKKLQIVVKRDAEEMKNLALECVKTEKNLTSKCVDGKIISKIQSETTDPFIIELAKRYLTASIPMTLQSEAMKTISVLDWLGACLAPIGTVAFDAAGKFSYQLKGPTVVGSGALVLPAQSNVKNLNSVQNACLGEIKNILRQQNYVLPAWSTEEAVAFYKAIPDFENYMEGLESVIFTGALRKTCGPSGQAACSEEDVLKRYKGWETVYRPTRDATPRTAGPAPELVRITRSLR